jgi:hypothetical protein
MRSEVRSGCDPRWLAPAARRGAPRRGFVVLERRLRAANARLAHATAAV